MSKENLSKFINSTKDSLSKYSPAILTGIGISGMVTSTILAVRATPKALALIEKERTRQNREITQIALENGQTTCHQLAKLSSKDVIKVTWKCYIPTIALMGVSIGCLIGASSVNTKRNAVLATAYKLSETAFSEYREKVVETIGEKKEQTIREKIHKEHVKNNPVSKSEVIITGKGETLCYDDNSGRYFKSDIEKIKRAINELNRRLLSYGYVSLNDFYDELDLKHTSIGDNLGWNVDGGLVDLDFSSQLSEDGTPCLVIDYRNPPKYDFNKFF